MLNHLEVVKNALFDEASLLRRSTDYFDLARSDSALQTALEIDASIDPRAIEWLADVMASFA